MINKFQKQSTDKFDYHGNLCFCCTFGEISTINKEYFLEEMIRNSSLVCCEEPSDAQCRAWISCQKVLSQTVKHLPDAYNNTWLIFEYVLPKHKPGTKKYIDEFGIRPDVLIVSKDFISVLEFKQRKLDKDNTVFSGYIFQAQKYVRRLKKYHTKSKNMKISPIVVLTLEKNYIDCNADYMACSGDKLADALISIFGNNFECMSHKEIVDWLCDYH